MYNTYIKHQEDFMSIHGKILEDLSHHRKAEQDLHSFWQLIAELLPAPLLDIPFSYVSYYSFGNPPTIELTAYDKEETWMNNMRKLFASQANVYFNPIVPAGHSWDNTRVKSEGTIYWDSVNCKDAALKVILIGPPTAKCRVVRFRQHVEEQKYIEAHDEEVEVMVCGDNLTEDAILEEEE
jgi:hypothetical protein